MVVRAKHISSPCGVRGSIIAGTDRGDRGGGTHIAEAPELQGSSEAGYRTGGSPMEAKTGSDGGLVFFGAGIEGMDSGRSIMIKSGIQ